MRICLPLVVSILLIHKGLTFTRHFYVVLRKDLKMPVGDDLSQMRLESSRTSIYSDGSRDITSIRALAWDEIYKGAA